MARKLHILVVLWACIAVGLASIFGGMVACSTVEGHRAIEAAHPLSGCAELYEQAVDTGEGYPEQPCNDVPLAGDDVTRPERNSDDSRILHLNPLVWFAVVPPARYVNIRLQFAAADSYISSPPLPDDLERLGTIVLLI